MSRGPLQRRRLRVYVAGPISSGDRLENIYRGLQAGKQMVRDGLAPHVPHFDAYMFPDDTISWNAFLEWDLEWVVQAEALYRLQGPSRGADLEVEKAVIHGIPIFYEDDTGAGYQALLSYAESLSLTGVRR